MIRRYLSVRLPFFPTQRFARQAAKLATQTAPFWIRPENSELDKTIDANAPLVLVSHGVKGTRISAANEKAQALGFFVDMKLTDARAMMPQLRVEQHDAAEDAQTIGRLAHWMQRYAPSVSLLADDHCLLLDIAGCAHLFGGEEMMARDIAERLARIGYSCLLAFADTPGACLALTSVGHKACHILPAGHAAAALDHLPVNALRLDHDTVLLLKRLGLKRIGDVRHLPRTALERRFHQDKKTKAASAAYSKAVQWRLDQLSGAIDEPFNYISEPVPYRASLQCPDLALEVEAVGIALDRLLDRLCPMLHKAGKGARGFRLTGYRADGGIGHTQLKLSQPSADKLRIKKLFKERLEKIDCGYGIDLFVLEAMGVEAVSANQNDMIDPTGANADQQSLANFADVLANRFEHSTVHRLSPRTSHVPERSQCQIAVTQAIDWEAFDALQPNWAPRPLRLLARPEKASVTAELPDSPPVQFVWRKVLRRVARARGPERIMAEWWTDNLTSETGTFYRDYYDVEDDGGMRYWLFRATGRHELKSAEDDMALAGEDEPTKPDLVPFTRWFVHGFF